ncbi:MAG: alpha/beta fold hydrolase [Proteobacteria bacterium]|nr:alpha/beta fold hydrolase [Pseudomonadota bacterium]
MSTALLRDTVTEGPRAAIELAAAFNPLVLSALFGLTPSGKGEPVLVLPGLGAHDVTTYVLRQYLSIKGYKPYGWDYGVNLGPRKDVIHHITELLHTTYGRHRQKISLIGHSMGGLYARALAKTYPDLVARVITLGSPFGLYANPEATVGVVRWLFEALNPDSGTAHDPVLLKNMLVPPDMPTTSIFSKKDGVVHWTACLNPATEQSENIEILYKASHCGLVMHPVVMALIAERLAMPTQGWRPFQASSMPYVLPFVSNPLTDATDSAAIPAHPVFTNAERARVEASRFNLGLRV